MALVLVRSVLAFTLLLLLADGALAQSTLIPLPARRDMVFDHSGNYLYISTSEGWVRRYNIAAAQLEPGYNLGGSLNGLDIAPDDSFVLVAQSTPGASQGTFHRVQLSNGEITDISYTRASGETGGWDVAIAANNIALVSTQFSGIGSTPLRQIDLTTNTITGRSDVPGAVPAGRVRQNTAITRSADATRLYLLDNPGFTYSATTNTFGPRATSAGVTAAVDRTGSAVVTTLSGFVSLDTVSGFNYLHTFSAVNSGVAFDAVQDRFYGVSSTTSQIVAYDATTFAELYRLNIGETVPSGTQAFGTGTLVASGDGRFLALATAEGVRIFALPTGTLPPAAPPTFNTPRDAVFDRSGERLYVTTADGFLWPYNLAAGSFETPINLGGSPRAVDIAVDNSFVIVAQGAHGLSQGAFQKVDLASGGVTNFNYTRASSEGGAWDVAIGSNGRAIGTTAYQGSGSTPLRDINLTSGALSTRSDAPGGGNVTNRTQIHRSADGTRMYLLQGNNSAGGVFTYSAVSDTFGPRVSTNTFTDTASAAVNRNGSFLATRLSNTGASLETAPNFGFIGSFSALTGGVAFDALSDTLYGVSTYLSQIVAYDTNTFAERFRFDIGETFSAGATQFGRGLLVASHDGRFLALNTGSTLRIYAVSALQLLSVASVKTHGDGTAFRVDLPLNGPPAVESRSGGANGAHTIVFSFDQNLATVGGATVTAGTGTVVGSSIDSADPRRYVVNLSGVNNQQTIKVTLADLVDAAGNRTGLLSAVTGVLLGDTTGDRAVNASDISETKARSGQALSAANFRADVNVSGAINATDIGITKSQSGSSIFPAARLKD
jgi:hypothetical protein